MTTLLHVAAAAALNAFHLVEGLVLAIVYAVAGIIGLWLQLVVIMLAVAAVGYLFILVRSALRRAWPKRPERG